MKIIFSAFYIIYFWFICVIMFPIAVVIKLFTFPFDKNLRILHLFSQFWGYMYLWIVPSWRPNISGKGKIDRNKTYLIVSNHQSMFDIVAVSRLFIHFKWVSKVEVFKMPFLGWNMSMNKYIKLKRGSRASIIQMVRDAEKTISQGSSVFIFPEGTRSDDGQLGSFFKGAFTIAKKKEVDILPIVIKGTNDALPKNSLKFNTKAKISVEVLDPLTYKDFQNKDVSEISDIIKKRIEVQLYN